MCRFSRFFRDALNENEYKYKRQNCFSLALARFETNFMLIYSF